MPVSSPRRPVVAAILRREGRILICQRSSSQSHPLKWEFPGGKVEPGEKPTAALVRELREELGISAAIGRRLQSITHRYGETGTVALSFYEVPAFSGEIENRIFANIVWERPEDLPRYDFLEADREIVQALAAGRY